MQSTQMQSLNLFFISEYTNSGILIFEHLHELMSW